MKSLLLSALLILNPLNLYTDLPFSSDSVICPYADIYEWRYKIENNYMYKRLYNLSKDCWEGPWIRC